LDSLTSALAVGSGGAWQELEARRCFLLPNNPKIVSARAQFSISLQLLSSCSKSRSSRHLFFNGRAYARCLNDFLSLHQYLQLLPHTSAKSF
jgi:hypothetical protein